jgi:hypothetical protein
MFVSQRLVVQRDGSGLAWDARTVLRIVFVDRIFFQAYPILHKFDIETGHAHLADLHQRATNEQ